MTRSAPTKTSPSKARRRILDTAYELFSQRGIDSETRLIAIFDLFDEWFHRDDFEGCSFINIARIRVR